MKQLKLQLKKKEKPLTKTEVFNLIADGNKKFKRADFFKWLSSVELKSYDKGHKSGYELGKSDGYRSGRRDVSVRSNY